MSGTRFGRRQFLKATSLAAIGAAYATILPRAYAAPKRMPDVVVLLPGIMGSVLRKDDKELWGVSTSSVINALRTLGRSVNTLKLKDDPPNVDDLGDGVKADRLFSDVHLIPGFWKIDGYTKVARRIAEEFDVQSGHNYFEFPYDWRRDNRVAARRLGRMTHDWLKAWRKKSGNQKAKLILIAHSMGGLVSRYFLECLDGWADTRMLITFGTPYRGSLNALNFISNGFKKQFLGLEIADLTDLLRSFTSVYQLLPIYPCYDAGDGKLLRIGETMGIPGVNQIQAAKALEFHREIKRAVDAHLKQDSYIKDHYTIHPIVGTRQPTLQSAKLIEKKVELSASFPGQTDDIDGDGTVPKPSATPTELGGKGTEVFISEVHGSLQNADPVLVQLSGLLASSPDIFRQSLPAVSIRMDDAYTAGEPIHVRSQCTEMVELKTTITDARTGRVVATHDMHPDADRVSEAEFAPLSEGVYRITIGNEGNANSVTDVFIVASK